MAVNFPKPDPLIRYSIYEGAGEISYLNRDRREDEQISFISREASNCETKLSFWLGANS